MEELLRDERELGRKEGRELGREEGRDEGEDRLSSLMMLLQENGRMEDMKRSWSDKAFREALYKEYGV